MSEKRFEVTDYGSNYYIEIIDNEKELDESIDNPSQKLGLVDCCDLLNEQQDLIEHLNKECMGLVSMFEKEVEENGKLRKQVAEYEMILRQHEFAEKEGFR